MTNKFQHQNCTSRPVGIKCIFRGRCNFKYLATEDDYCNVCTFYILFQYIYLCVCLQLIVRENKREICPPKMFLDQKVIRSLHLCAFRNTICVVCAASAIFYIYFFDRAPVVRRGFSKLGIDGKRRPPWGHNQDSIVSVANRRSSSLYVAVGVCACVCVFSPFIKKYFCYAVWIIYFGDCLHQLNSPAAIFHRVVR